MVEIKRLKTGWFVLGSLIVLVTGFYAYEFPLKSYIAQKNLYELLEGKEGIAEEDIQIQKIRKDYKSARSGYVIYFTVKESPLDYCYDYSFEFDDWIMGYVSEGTIYSTDKIILREE
ncbi:DUF3139 domain-containing protein [Trichococcus patagoniensis]|nr:DUF3139 domain-containing protein [Trichococcus patagoniensis]